MIMMMMMIWASVLHKNSLHSSTTRRPFDPDRHVTLCSQREFFDSLGWMTTILWISIRDDGYDQSCQTSMDSWKRFVVYWRSYRGQKVSKPFDAFVPKTSNRLRLIRFKRFWEILSMKRLYDGLMSVGSITIELNNWLVAIAYRNGMKIRSYLMYFLRTP